MATKKKILISIPLNFKAEVIIPKLSFDVVDKSIGSGQMCVGVNLDSEDNSYGLTIYPDTIDGELSFTRTEELLKVSAAGIYKMEYGEFEREHLKLPAKVILYSVVDDNADSYYFGPSEEGIDLNIQVEKPLEK